MAYERPHQRHSRESGNDIRMAYDRPHQRHSRESGHPVKTMVYVKFYPNGSPVTLSSVTPRERVDRSRMPNWETRTLRKLRVLRKLAPNLQGEREPGRAGVLDPMSGSLGTSASKHLRRVQRGRCPQIRVRVREPVRLGDWPESLTGCLRGPHRPAGPSKIPAHTVPQSGQRPSSPRT